MAVPMRVSYARSAGSEGAPTVSESSRSLSLRATSSGTVNPSKRTASLAYCTPAEIDRSSACAARISVSSVM
jgi:hypothetical protein